MSMLLSRRQRAVAKTARSAVRAYGAVKCTQGKLAARRRHRGHGRTPLLIAAGGGAAVGFLAHPQVWRQARSLAQRNGEGAGAEELAPAAPVGEEQIAPNGAPVAGRW